MCRVRGLARLSFQGGWPVSLLRARARMRRNADFTVGQLPPKRSNRRWNDPITGAINSTSRQPIEHATAYVISNVIKRHAADNLAFDFALKQMVAFGTRRFP
jgi:hypothetical protein